MEGKWREVLGGTLVFQLATESIMSFSNVETKMSLATRCVPVQIAT